MTTQMTDVSRFKNAQGQVDPMMVARVWQVSACNPAVTDHRGNVIMQAMKELDREHQGKAGWSHAAKAFWHDRMASLWSDYASSHEGKGWGSAASFAHVAATSYESAGNKKKAAELTDRMGHYGVMLARACEQRPASNRLF